MYKEPWEQKVSISLNSLKLKIPLNWTLLRTSVFNDFSVWRQSFLTISEQGNTIDPSALHVLYTKPEVSDFTGRSTEYERKLLKRFKTRGQQHKFLFIRYNKTIEMFCFKINFENG